MPASGKGFVPPEEFTLEDFNRVMITNLGSCFLGLKYVTPIMKKQGGGSIINNGSTAGVTTDGSGPLYSASKAGVIHITKVWATQLAEFGVRVNCISPGAIVAPIFLGRPPYPIGRGKRTPDPTADRILCKSVTAQSCRYAGRHCLRRVVFGQ